jgi:hypothetical protein
MLMVLQVLGVLFLVQKALNWPRPGEVRAPPAAWQYDDLRISLPGSLPTN